ncbi:hypothetical protein D1BOALGB6SA_8226 [Olavius sp. associated proteobacterium Delta 1]|nr:hypothetical protein D1BOALGB6SA_8226 [Olavius sp. associated proteobacterium Delta 1]
MKRFVFNGLFYFNCPYKIDSILIRGGGREKIIKSASRLPSVLALSGVINAD